MLCHRLQPQSYTEVAVQPWMIPRKAEKTYPVPLDRVDLYQLSRQLLPILRLPVFGMIRYGLFSLSSSAIHPVSQRHLGLVLGHGKQ